MKKNMIALAVAAAFAAPVAMADAPVVYGKINVNINSVTDNGNGVNDTASRVGIKGSEDLGNGLKAVYKMEFDVDVAGAGGLKGRNQYLGLAGGFGTVLIGRHDSPMKMAQPTDTFNDGAADNNATVMGALGATGEDRAAHVLAYVSPSFSGVKLILAGTSPKSTAVAPATSDDRSITGGTHAAVTYGSTKKGLFLSAAMNTFSADTYNTTGQVGAKNYDETSFSAQYKVGGLTANATVRGFDDGEAADGRDEGTATIANLAYKMGKFTVKGKIMQADYANNDKTGTQTAVGLAYALGKKTTAYVYTTTKDKNINTGGSSKSTVALGKSVTASYVGLVHKF
jgi:predicted porin